MKTQTILMERLTPEAVQQRKETEQSLLSRIKKDADNDETPPETVCKALVAYCDLLKQDAIIEKNQFITDRAAKPPQPQGVIAQMLETSRAPYGLDDEGTPLTGKQFRRAMAPPITNLYGLGDADWIEDFLARHSPSISSNAANPPNPREGPPPQPDRWRENPLSHPPSRESVPVQQTAVQSSHSWDDG